MVLLPIFIISFISVAVPCGFASLNDAKPVGVITFLQQRPSNPVQIYTEGSHRRLACDRCMVYEGDLIHTRKGQMINVAFNDGSEISVAESTRVVIEQWHKKEKEFFNRRSFFLIRGGLHVIVKKIYSFEEPFLVRTSTSVIAVRGTEFVTLINETEVNKFKKDQGVTLYALEGEVHFARDEDDLKSGRFALVTGGYFSTLQSGFSKPTTPKQFKMNFLTHEVGGALAGVSKFKIKGNHYYAKADQINSLVSPHTSLDRQPIQRAIASVQPYSGLTKGQRRNDLRSEATESNGGPDDLASLSKKANSLRERQRALDRVPEAEEPPAPGDLTRKNFAVDEERLSRRQSNRVLRTVTDPGGYPGLLDRQPAGMSGSRPDLSRQVGNLQSLINGKK